MGADRSCATNQGTLSPATFAWSGAWNASTSTGTINMRVFDAYTCIPRAPQTGWSGERLVVEPAEDGRGFFMEWRNGTLDIAGYMYDDAGNPVWYLTVGAIGGTSTARSFSGNWWSYGNGMTLIGPWRPNQQLSTNVAPLAITFTSSTTALMTLPNGRTTTLQRHRF